MYLDDWSPIQQGLRRPFPKDLRKREELGPLNEEQLKPLDILQEELISPPVLTLPKRKGQFTLDTDGCDRQVGGVQLQRQEDGKERAIGYWSGTLSKPKKNHDTAH